MTATQSANDVTPLHIRNWRQEPFDNDNDDDDDGNESIGNKRRKEYTHKTLLANRKWKHSFWIYIYMSCCIWTCSIFGNVIERQCSVYMLCLCICTKLSTPFLPFWIPIVSRWWRCQCRWVEWELLNVQ